MQEQMPAGAEAPVGLGDRATRSGRGLPLDDHRLLQILSTEHWSLLATRSLSYNEAFSRAGMFLSFLAASLVALGLISTATGFTSQLALIAAVVLATDMFIGFATLGRILSAGQEEQTCVAGMNRIRHAYREMVPGIEPYFVTPFHDDAASVLSVYGVPPASRVGSVVHGLTTTPALVGVVNSVVAGALAAVVLLGVGASLELSLLAGLLGFAIVFAIGFQVGYVGSVRWHRRRIAQFPATSPDEAPPG